MGKIRVRFASFCVFVLSISVLNAFSGVTLQILSPTQGQKIELPNVPVKGTVIFEEEYCGKIKWETNIEGIFKTETNPDEEGSIFISSFPDLNSSFGNNTITAIIPSNFTVTVSPTMNSVKQGASASHTITIKNLDPSNATTFDIRLNPSGVGWTWSTTEWLDVQVAANGTGSRTYTVTNKNASTPLNTAIKVTHKISSEIKSTACIDVPDNPPPPPPGGPGGDGPDDNHSLTSTQYPTPWLFDSDSKIGVLSSGWGAGLNYLLGKYKIATTSVAEDFSMLGSSEKSINDLDVLCIGSGGLEEIASSADVREKLASYVFNGGRLIVLAVQRGSSLSALPGGEVAGYGWTEDMSCFNAAVYIDTYHQILSSLTGTYADVNVDGYFTKWPDSAKVLLRRTKNGMPAMVAYQFGKGTVIATSMYSDYAYGHNQASEQEENIVRDMVTWASAGSKILPEFKPGDTASFSFTARNSSGFDAAKLILTTLDPNRNLVKTDTLVQSIAAGDSLTVSYSFQSDPTSPLGIWQVRYSFFDSIGDTLQSEHTGGMFAVSNPSNQVVSKPITFDVTSDAENYVYGSTGLFTITVWNHTETTRHITVWWSFPHNYWGTGNPVFGAPGTGEPGHRSALKQTLEVPANGNKTMTLNVPLYTWDRLWTDFYDENNKYLGRASRGFLVYNPSCNVTIIPERQEYIPGDTVVLNLDLKNTQMYSSAANVHTIVLNPENSLVWENNVEVDLPSNVSVKRSFSFTLPSGALRGTYTVKTEVSNNGNRGGSSSAFFTVPEPCITLSPLLPAVIRQGDNVLSFSIENCSSSPISGGIMEAKLLYPDGGVALQDTKPFTLDNSGTGSAGFAMHLDRIDFGNYSLSYHATYSGLSSKEVIKSIPSACDIAVTEENPCQIRKPASFDLDITNAGPFEYSSIAYEISLPGAESKTGSFRLGAFKNDHIPVSFTIPETWYAGIHNGTVSLTLASGSSVSQDFEINIPWSKVSAAFDTVSSYQAGQTISAFIPNDGGIDARALCSLKLADVSGVTVASFSETLTVRAGEVDTIGLAIPVKVKTCGYEVSAVAAVLTEDLEPTRANKRIEVAGVQAGFSVRTDKKIYQLSDVKTASAALNVSGGSIENGTLSLMAVRTMDSSLTWTTQADWAAAETNSVDINSSPGDVIGMPTLTSEGLVGYWNFEEGSGDTVHDATGNGHDGRIYGATWTNTPFGKGLSFNGFSDYVEVSNVSDGIFDFGTGDFTIAAWIRTTGGSGYSRDDVIIKGDPFNSGFGMSVRNSRISSYIGNTGSGAGYNDNSMIVNDDVWHHVISLRRSGMVMIYADGMFQFSYLYSGTVTVNTNLIFGKHGTKNESYYEGMLDEVRIYNRALSTDEISGLYAGLSTGGVSFIAFKIDAGQTASWNSASWDATTPAGANINIVTRTAETEASLGSASFAAPCSVSGAAISSPPDRWLELRVKFISSDPQNVEAVLHSLTLNFTKRYEEWSSSRPLDLAGQQTFDTAMGSFSTGGRYVLEGTVKNGFNQEMSLASYPFYIADAPLVLTFTPDKTVYKPGETITVSGLVFNNSQLDVPDCAYELRADNAVVFSETAPIPAGGIHAFSFTMTAPEAPVALTGIVEGKKTTALVAVERPEIGIEAIAPAVVGHEPFDFGVRLTNTKRTDANIIVTIAGESKPVVVPGGQTITISKKLTITATTTIDVAVSGDATASIQKQIQFGEAAQITVTAQAAYPEGNVVIPYSVMNRSPSSLMNLDFDLVFTMNGDTIIRKISVTQGFTLNDKLSFYQSAGTYTLNYSSLFGSRSVTYRVAKTNQVAMQLEIGRHSTPKVLILRDDYSDQLYKSVLEAEGMQVRITDQPFPWWNGTNPSPDGFNVIVLPCANYYFYQMSAEGQNALISFVNNGGGFLPIEWITYGQAYYNSFNLMNDILLFDPSQWNYSGGDQTFEKVGAHPITLDLPSSFYCSFYHNGNSGGLKPGATAILRGSFLPNAVAVKQQGKGRIVQFALEANVLATMCTSDENIKKLLVNSINWAGKSNEGTTLGVRVVMTNQGIGGFDGQLKSSTAFFSKTEDVSTASGASSTIKYDWDISAVPPGNYTLAATAFAGGTIVKYDTLPFTIDSAVCTLTVFPANAVYQPGQLVTMKFAVKNTGVVEGKAGTNLKVLDMEDESHAFWIAPGMEMPDSFTFQIPDDYPDGEYKAQFSLNGVVSEIPFTVSGIKLIVTATLDKPIYSPGETAVLTLDITNQSTLNPAAYCAARSGGGEDRVDFTLQSRQTMQLRIPVDANASDRIAYGIYHASGRAIYLNTIYLRIMNGPVGLYTNKTVYLPGDTVLATCVALQSGDFSASTNTGFDTAFALIGTANFSFVLPGVMASGSYTIRYQLGEYSGDCYFDVAGYSVKVHSVTLDKAVYDPVDRMTAGFKVISNSAVPVIIKGWIYSPDGSYNELFEMPKDLVIGENDISITADVTTTAPETHKLVYGIYKAGTLDLLVSGSKAFDVKEAAILAVTPDKAIYDQSETILLSVNTKALTPYVGRIEILNGADILDGKDVSLAGSETHEFTVGPLPAGRHTLIARLSDGTQTVSERSCAVAVADLRPPAAPLALGLISQGASATLSWNANTEQDLAGYNLYCNAAKVNAYPSRLIRAQYQMYASGKQYAFYVTAVDKAGNESGPSNAVTAIFDNSAPVITMAPSSDVLSSVPVTISYSVKDNLDPSPNIEATYGSPTVFRLDGTYLVRIAATDASGNRAEKQMSVVIESGAPAQIRTLAAYDAKTNGTINLEWSYYEEAPDVVSYRIYRSESDFTTVQGMSPFASVAKGALSYQVTGLENGIRYFFAVVAVDRYGNADPGVITASAVPTTGKGAVKVASSPAGAETFLGGNYAYPGIYQGVAPLKISELREDAYVLRIQAPGYETYYSLANIIAGETTEVSAVMRQSSGFGYTTGVKVQASGVPLNFGSSAKPFVIDWNLDGKKDLMGIDAANSIVVYLNSGSDIDPRFNSSVAVLRNVQGIYSVFAVDYDNDLKNDLLAGLTDGNTVLFKNTGTNEKPIFDGDPIIVPIHVSGNAAPFVYDWNADGKKDLLIGDGTGVLKVFLNTGTDAEPAFNTVPDASPIVLSSGNAVPFTVVDWNRDSLFDIVSGEAGGCLNVFANTGTATCPAFGPARPIRASNTQICVGSDAAPFVVDWNNDGLKDLLIGAGDGTVMLYLATPNVPPVADAGPNISIVSKDKDATVIVGHASDENEGDVLSFRWLKNDTVLCNWKPVSPTGACTLSLAGSALGIGSHPLTLEVSDGLAASRDEMVLTIGNSAPGVAPAGAGVYELNTPVTLGGSVSDYDGDAVNFKWFKGPQLIYQGMAYPPKGGAPVALPTYAFNYLPLGIHILTLTVSDGVNASVDDSIEVKIVDTSVPTLAPVANTSMLWPPNHKMVDIVIMANAGDNSGFVTLSAAISSNEPQDGLGDGDKSPDWTAPQIDQSNGRITFQLRAERSGKGEGRVYTIRISAADISNNVSSADIKIVVPHDNGEK
jgi:hypothetical protein